MARKLLEHSAMVRSLTSLALVATWALVSCSDDDSELAPQCADMATTRQAFTRRCFPRTLEVETNPDSPGYGRVPCKLYAAFPSGSNPCACDATGYAPTERPPPSVVDELAGSGLCEAPCCEQLCWCELKQLSGDELAQCQNGTDGAITPVGWCYVSPEQGIGDESVVAACPADQKRLLRVVPVRHNIQGALVCQSEQIVLPPDDAGS